MNGCELITQERKRQIKIEGWTAEHDAHHSGNELALAAASYAIPDNHLITGISRRCLWPWSHNGYKETPKQRIKELTKAGALIAAEIDRLQGLEASQNAHNL